jgi:UDP-N-acetylmuramyl pentapeptide phosphotransferase/UDP-N-acetylglucosamine-1-phosphate transferase
MLSVLVSVVIFVWFLGNAVRQIRRQQAMGLKMQWDKTLATAGGCILVTGAGLGSLFAGLTLDAPILGTAGCAVLMIGGMIGLIILVNRRWPRRPGE